VPWPQGLTVWQIACELLQANNRSLKLTLHQARQLGTGTMSWYMQKQRRPRVHRKTRCETMPHLMRARQKSNCDGFLWPTMSTCFEAGMRQESLNSTYFPTPQSQLKLADVRADAHRWAFAFYHSHNSTRRYGVACHAEKRVFLQRTG
jgi:hypothetical protein